MTQHVYFFGEGNKDMKALLGGKGAHLNEMTNLGLPVPAGFTITTEVCNSYYDNNQKHKPEVIDEIWKNVAKAEKSFKEKFGDKKDPLLFSVRSGAPISMPGMMDTVLNLGLNDETVIGLAEKSGNERFAYDSYRRLMQMFGNVVLGIDSQKFERIMDTIKETKGFEQDTDLDTEHLKEVIADYKQLIIDEVSQDFPQDPKKQLLMAIDAVFDSWNNSRAVKYRRLNNIIGFNGTAVNVQAMVFGNMGAKSGTGVCFTRNPATGENVFYGEYLMNAQGEDVVAGIRTPQKLDTLEKINPKVYAELLGIRNKLEKHYKNMQDLEFTIEEGKLYILQTRDGKRTAAAAIKIAVDMAKEGLIDKKAAVLMVDPNQLEHLLHRQLDDIAKQKAQIIGKALPASPGAAVGKVVFSPEIAIELKLKGESVILVRTETSPEDIEGMDAAMGILTARGGMTSHAAVVARGMGKPCVVGWAEMTIIDKYFKVKDIEVKEGDHITLDGTEGVIYLGEIPTVEPEMSGDFAELMEWANSYRRLGVRTNADTPKDCKTAREFGAEGLGLCRTEHMFFEGKRIRAMREMIMAQDTKGRKEALNQLLPMQRDDFIQIFLAMKGLPVTIRLLDPPLHEFLPQTDDELKEFEQEGIGLDDLKLKLEELKEVNPMLGHRGCRLAITYPEIAEMQTRAIIEAAIESKESKVEIMVPLVGHVNELIALKKVINETAKIVMEEKGKTVNYTVGTMIEIPRAAITADEIAKEADFFSFGTNDLTQMTFGFSRDDIGKFINEYTAKGILVRDPFHVLDQEGVGKLVIEACEKGRKTKKDIKLGICGEHGGEPSSVEFCHRAGLDYVSCSPFRVPVAILAAAQAALR